MQRVVITRLLPEHLLQPLRARAAAGGLALQMHGEEPMPRAALLAARRGEPGLPGAGCAGVLCLLSDEMNAEAVAAAGPGLRVVSTLSAGVSHVDLAACARARVRVGHTPDVLTDATADLAVALLLAVARRLPAAAAAARGGADPWASWKPFWLCGRPVAGAAVGIVGLGRIGAAVARRLAGFGCKLAYTGGAGAKPEAEAAHAAAAPLAPPLRYLPLDELLATSDVVILACALTPATRGLLSYARLAAMRDDAALINVARGEVVDQDALARILAERPRMLAGLDVTTPEPLPLDSPLLRLDNCLVLPHIGSATTPCREEMCRIAVDNLIAGLDGAPMRAEVALPAAV